jgi:hypothetical protein
MARSTRRRLPPILRAFGATLGLGLQIVANGCASPESLYIQGTNKAVVGELAIFYVSTNPGCGKAIGGPSDPTAILCPPSHGVSMLVDAVCDGGACVLDSFEPPNSNDLLILHVIGITAGPTVLRVRAILEDGSELSATSSVSFVTATGLHAHCALAVVAGGLLPAFGQCGGLYPVFTGSSWKWTISFDTDSGPLGVADPSFSVQGDAVVYDSASGSFRSGSTTGTAQVMISSRQFTKTVPVRVVSTTDVVSGELRLADQTDGIEQEISQIGPAPNTLWYPTRNGLQFEGDSPGTVAILSLLTLSDGTQVYGGGGLLASDHPEVCSAYPRAAGANLLQQTSVLTDCRSNGSATFTAAVGVATITWPVTVAQTGVQSVDNAEIRLNVDEDTLAPTIFGPVMVMLPGPKVTGPPWVVD